MMRKAALNIRPYSIPRGAIHKFCTVMSIDAPRFTDNSTVIHSLASATIATLALVTLWPIPFDGTWCEEDSSGASVNNTTSPMLEVLRRGWDDFMVKSMNPDDDDDGEEVEGVDEEETDEKCEAGPTNNVENGALKSSEEEKGLPENLASSDAESVGCRANTDEINNRENDQKDIENINIIRTTGISEKEDFHDSPLEEEEPTTCTICIINRKGPCRFHWRKFEQCMKHYDKNSDTPSDISDGDDSDIISKEGRVASLGEKCDKYMFPWITCVQSHRNTYTLITNAVYQEEFVDDVERGVDKMNKVFFGEFDPTVFLDMSEWLSREKMKCCTHGLPSKDDKQQRQRKDSDCDEDLDIIPSSVMINLTDGATGKLVDIAYVRDQDGKILGFDQFTTLKRERRELLKKQEHEKKNCLGEKMIITNDIDKSASNNENQQYGLVEKSNDNQDVPNIGSCTFYISPESTKSIQVFSLYKNDDNVDVLEGMNSRNEENQLTNGNNNKDEKTANRIPNETLYYSRIISLDEIAHLANKE